jgi:lysophospholipase L1-like esterase
MNISIKIIIIFLAFVLIISGIQYLKVYVCIKKGNDDIQPWNRFKPDAAFKVLFAGDSTAVGTGLSDSSQSIAGLFGRDFPDLDVENYSQNGLRLKGLADILETLQHKQFDLAVLQIGANDIMFFTPIEKIKDDQQRVLNLARHIAKRIIILHSGDIGGSPLFIWPFSWVYTWRSLKVREIYAQRQNDTVSYIDIYHLNKGRDYRNCYGRDGLHLNKKGYAIWYGYIKDQLLKLHWLPNNPGGLI